MDWQIVLVPVAVLALLALFRFVGCDGAQVFGVVEPYPDDVLSDTPVVYYRLQEPPGSAVAKDLRSLLDGLYGVADGVQDLPLLSGPAASVYFSLPIVSPVQVLGAPSILPKSPADTSVRFGGGFVLANGSLGDLQRFSVDVLAHPEWDIANERNYYSVVDYSNFVPGLGASGPNRNAGFAIYAGPDNPLDPASPVCWQLWVGTGAAFARAIPVGGGPGPRVTPENTYLAVQFDDVKAFLWAYTIHADVAEVQFELSRPAYVQAADPDPSRLSLRVGASGEFAGLVPPFPSPAGFLIYPFVGRIAEVAIYNTALNAGRIIFHILNGFNTA